jgi:hypothetical protein
MKWGKFQFRAEKGARRHCIKEEQDNLTQHKLDKHAIYPNCSKLRGITFKNKFKIQLLSCCSL